MNSVVAINGSEKSSAEKVIKSRTTSVGIAHIQWKNLAFIFYSDNSYSQNRMKKANTFFKIWYRTSFHGQCSRLPSIQLCDDWFRSKWVWAYWVGGKQTHSDFHQHFFQTNCLQFDLLPVKAEKRWKHNFSSYKTTISRYISNVDGFNQQNAIQIMTKKPNLYKNLFD